jgi:ubiquinone/menaquinone biosynthesis C-methylase UbiE
MRDPSQQMHRCGILFVHGGEQFAREVYRRERRGYWASALSLVLEKHGFLAVSETSPDVLESKEALRRADIVLVARLPEAAWTRQAMEVVCEATTPILVEGPLPEALNQALGITLEGEAAEPGAIVSTDSRTTKAALRFGMRPGGVVKEPDSRPVSRIPELEWSVLKSVPITSRQAEAWRASGWDAVRWGGVDSGEVLAEWVSPEDKTDRFPAVVRNGHLVGCSFGFLTFLGQRHTSEPFDGPEHRTASRSAGLEALLLGLIDEMYVWSGETRARILPWPHGARWVRSVRHDYDRPISNGEIESVLRMHEAAGSAATWYWRTRHLDGGGVRIVAESPRHEVAVHTERNWFNGDDESAQLEQALGSPPLGSSAHGGNDCFRFQGAPNVLWAESQGLRYSELIQHAHFHPHRFAALGEDGMITPLSLICLPHHESFDLSTTPGDTNLDRLRKVTPQWIEAQGFMQVMNHPDQNVAELFSYLDEMPAEDRLEWTAAECADWWSRSHVRDNLTIRPLGDGRFKITSRLGVDSLSIELLAADGTKCVKTVDLAEDHHAIVSMAGIEEAKPLPTWQQVSKEYSRVIREYNENRGRDPLTPAVQSTIRTNSELVPKRGDQLLRLLNELTESDIAGKQVLEVGCGFGALAAYLALRGRPEMLVATDIRRDFLEAARECASEVGLDGLVNYVETDMRDMKMLPTGALDVVIVNNAFIYLTTKQAEREAISEFRRVLRPGGRIVFFHANKWRWREPFTQDPMVHLLPRPLATVAGSLTGWKHNHGRVRLISAPALRRQLRRARFGDVQIVGFGKERATTGLKRYTGNFYALAAQRIG